MPIILVSIMDRMISLALEVKDVLLQNKPDGAFPKEKVIMDATAQRARMAAAKEKSASPKARAMESDLPKPSQP